MQTLSTNKSTKRFIPFTTQLSQHQGFIQNIFLGGGNVDSCNGHMRVSVHSLRFLWIFVKLWTCLRTRNVKFSCNTLSLCTLLCCIHYCSWGNCDIIAFQFVGEGGGNYHNLRMKPWLKWCKNLWVFHPSLGLVSPYSLTLNPCIS